MTKKFLKKIHKRMPEKVKAFYRPILWGCLDFYNKYLKTVFRLYLPVYIVRPKEPDLLNPLVFAYCGTAMTALEYWAGQVLKTESQKCFIGASWIWRITALLKRKQPDCHFVLTETLLPWTVFLSRVPGFNVPAWMRMEIDINRPIKKMWKRRSALSNDIQRRIRKHHLNYCITHDIEEFENFYHNMHVPYIQKRFKGSANIEDYYFYRNIFLKGNLFLITKDNESIAGMLVRIRKSVPELVILGVKDADHEYVRQGAIGAMYYFSVIHYQKEGYKKIHIGGTRPVLSDGLTSFKISLKAKIIHSVSVMKHCMWLRLLKDAPAARQFLLNNPFVFFKKINQPYCAIFIDEKACQSKEAFLKATRSSLCLGLVETHLYVFGDTKPAQELVKKLKLTNIEVKPASSAFI